MSAILIIYLLWLAFQRKEQMEHILSKNAFYALLAIVVAIVIDGITYFNYFKLITQ